MFEKGRDRELENYKFLASLQGIDISDKSKDAKKKQREKIQNTKLPNGNEVPMFMDPKDYEGMSETERNELTDVMMKGWKHFANNVKMGV